MTLPVSAAVLLHDALEREGGSESLLFEDVRRVICCTRAEDIEGAVREAHAALESGLYLAGAITYELGYHVEPKLRGLARAGGPLFVLGAFARCSRLSSEEALRFAQQQAQNCSRTASPIELKRSETASSYAAKVARIRQYILAGDIYQANLTFFVSFDWGDDPWSLYLRLARHQRVSFGAVIELPQCRITSLSPELFFRKRGDRVEARPMKGTMRRGNTPEQDRMLAEALRRDVKNRAENLMILDLIRNDIGRIARIGSVSVPHAFQIETYETLHQMTSTVVGQVVPDIPPFELLGHLFPCGSVTGAPKIRAMEVIAELEDAPRGFYTGALGYMTPERDMCFSVPIRTIVLDGAGRARMGIGSGIVADSDVASEFDECLLKARFLELGLA